MAKNSTLDILVRLVALDEALMSVEGMHRSRFARHWKVSVDTIKRDQEALATMGHPSVVGTDEGGIHMGDARGRAWHYKPGVSLVFLDNVPPKVKFQIRAMMRGK